MEMKKEHFEDSTNTFSFRLQHVEEDKARVTEMDTLLS
jgi:hypothetical protein